MVSDELAELKKILKILTLAHSDAIEGTLSKIATTDERKQIWVLVDGNLMSKDIADRVGITEDAVNKFLRVLQRAELIDNPPRKPPRRLIDYVPPSWIDLLRPEEEIETELGEIQNE